MDWRESQRQAMDQKFPFARVLSEGIIRQEEKVPRASCDGVEDHPPKHAVLNKRNRMNFKQNSFLTRMNAPVLLAAALSLLIAGCASQSPPPCQPPAAQVVPPPFALTGEQIAKLCQAAPDTCRRIQTLQPLTLADVKVMAKLGFGSDVIIAQVRNSRTVYHLTADAIIDLKNSGVSNQVIDFLITTPSSIAGSTPVPEPQTNYPGSQTPPPPPPAETQPPAPGPEYVWVGGDWVWNGGWVWVGGHWAYPPFPGAVWFHGGWAHGWGRFHRMRGYWH
jgi:hypothetical protein